MPELGTALEDGDAGFHVDRHEVEGLAHRRRRQLAGEDGLEHLHARERAHLFVRGDAGRHQTRTHALFFVLPTGNDFVEFHR